MKGRHICLSFRREEMSFPGIRERANQILRVSCLFSAARQGETHSLQLLLYILSMFSGRVVNVPSLLWAIMIQQWRSSLCIRRSEAVPTTTPLGNESRSAFGPAMEEEPA